MSNSVSNDERDVEQRILQAVKMTLTGVIRDTATPAGMRHPLTDQTITDLRACLSLISARERELAQAAGAAPQERPRFADEPRPVENVIRFYDRKKPGDEEQGG